VIRRFETGGRAGRLRDAGAESLVARGLLAVESDGSKFVRVRPTSELLALIRREIEMSRAFPAPSFTWLRKELERWAGEIA